MKKNWIILGVVAIGGYIIWKKMKAKNNNNNDVVTPIITKPLTNPAPKMDSESVSNNDLI
jgi:hypothetical protein